MEIVKKIILASFSLVFFVTGSTFAKNDGVNPILELAGIEKPVEWSRWRENQKHNWLQENGIYPQNGRKYKGNFDIDSYFESLGVKMPEDWYELSFTERKLFVENIGTEEIPQLETVAPSTTPSVISSAPQKETIIPENNEENNLFSIYTIIAFGLIFSGVILFFVVSSSQPSKPKK